MTAEQQHDDTPLTPDEIAAEIKAAGIPLTAGNLQAMITAARAASERNEAADRETERRHRPHPLLVLTPEFMNEDTPRNWAERGELNAWKVGGRWFSTIADVEEWMIRTDRFPTKEAEERWRATMARRFS
jgi:hypothetical protein